MHQRGEPEFLRFLKNKRIVILTRAGTTTRWAGDWLQALKTAEAIKKYVPNTEHFVYREDSSEGGIPERVKQTDFTDLNDVDVIHFIPGRICNGAFHRWYQSQKNKPLLVGSSIFWDSRVHRDVIIKNRKLNVLVEHLKEFYRSVFRPKPDFLNLFDVILPNSMAEIYCCRNYLQYSPEAIWGNVPNGIDIPPDWVSDTSQHKDIPFEEYVVYPGVFHPRKNQLGFIRALRGAPYSVVFMGGSAGESGCNQYYEQCRREADKTWVFLGQVTHKSTEFYQTLKHARVACLASSCETPGIAILEAANLGVRPAITQEGGAIEYLGFDAEYFNPMDESAIRSAVERAWLRGRLSRESADALKRFTWEKAAEISLFYYFEGIKRRSS